MLQLKDSAREQPAGVLRLDKEPLPESWEVLLILRSPGSKEKREATNKELKRFAQAHRLQIAEVHGPQHTMRLTGATTDIAKAFKVDLAVYQSGQAKYLSHTKPVSVPKDLAGVVVGVLNLDTQASVRSQGHLAQDAPAARRLGKTRAPAGGVSTEGLSYSVPELARLYDFPEGTGEGQCIGVIALDGGYKKEDINRHFKELKLQQEPQIISHGENKLSQSEVNNYLVSQSIQIVGALAPAAKIVVYHQNSSDLSLAQYYLCFGTAIHDQENNPSVLVNGWFFNENPGAAFPGIRAQDVPYFETLFKQAKEREITICSASGSQGALMSVASIPRNESAAQWVTGTSVPVVQYPASSPWHLACGGTSLFADPEPPKIHSEVAWNRLAQWLDIDQFPSSGGATGGGVSRLMKLPQYQEDAGVPQVSIKAWVDGELKQKKTFKGRGVPDVAADADLFTGYRIWFNEKPRITGGTGVVAPLWAGLIARLNQRLGRRVGFINPILYELQLKKRANVLRSITSGSNGAYTARPDELWNACCGLGVPRGKQLLTELEKYYKGVKR